MKWDTYHTTEIKQKYIYRYVTLEKLVDFLETGELFLTRLDKFEDNLENISPFDINELKFKSRMTSKPKNPNPSIPEHHWDQMIKNSKADLIKLQEKLVFKQKHRFVSCWILSDVESFAMWDIYGKSGFAIRFDRSYFQDIVKSSIELQTGNTNEIDLLVSGTVIYQNYDVMTFKEKESLIKFSVFRKHLSFNHENEYRLVGFMKEIIDEPGLRFKLPNLEKLEFTLIANPRLSRFQFDKYRGILSNYSKIHQLTESQLKIWLEFRNMNYK